MQIFILYLVLGIFLGLSEASTFRIQDRTDGITDRFHSSTQPISIQKRNENPPPKYSISKSVNPRIVPTPPKTGIKAALFTTHKYIRKSLTNYNLQYNFEQYRRNRADAENERNGIWGNPHMAQHFDEWADIFLRNSKISVQKFIGQYGVPEAKRLLKIHPYLGFTVDDVADGEGMEGVK